MSLRRTGRTTKMLINMAKWLCDNYGKQRTVVFITYRQSYSKELLGKLRPLLLIEQVNSTTFRHGNTLIFCTSYDAMESNPDRLRGMGEYKIFSDHHTGERGRWIPV